MTCCIVVALIISQILAYRDRIKRLLGFEVDANAGQDPLLPPGLLRRCLQACVPALALCATAALGYQHRHHLAELITPAAYAANPTIAGDLCEGTADGNN